MSRSSAFQRIVWLNEKEKRQDALVGWGVCLVISIFVGGIAAASMNNIWFITVPLPLVWLMLRALVRLQNWKRQEP